MSKEKFVVIGMGAFGKEVARTLKSRNADVIIMDKNPAVVSQMKQEGFEFVVELDSSESSILPKFIKPEYTVILAMGESFEDTILTVAGLSDIGVKKIYTRATNEIQIRILEKLDITEILFPEKQEGNRFALNLLDPSSKIVEVFGSDVLVSEVKVPKEFYGKTVIELNIRNRFNINVIGIRGPYLRKDGVEIEKVLPTGFETIRLTDKHKLIIAGYDKDVYKISNYDKENHH